MEKTFIKAKLKDMTIPESPDAIAEANAVKNISMTPDRTLIDKND